MSNKKYPTPPRCPGFVHQVRQRESLFQIAKNYRITLQEVIDANPQIANPNSIDVGQYVCIPGITRKTVCYSTGPLAIDPLIQSFIGVIVENNTSFNIKATIRLFDKDSCPKILVFELVLHIPPGCAFTPFFDIPGFFYEVKIEVSDLPEILITVYGLTEQFGVVAANTLRYSELTLLRDLTGVKEIAHNTATLNVPPETRQWEKV